MRLLLFTVVLACAGLPPVGGVSPEFNCGREVMAATADGFDACEWTWTCHNGVERRYHWTPAGKTFSAECLEALK